ncbi:MAG TPA: type IV secretion system DNA-binding domain-containing protein [Nitrolancea sp.]|nr:type IV secretion system DNA-binding domain-containing protein [Nitrolancea sp.]
MNPPPDTIFGIENREFIGISVDDRRQGVYIIGSNGTGKSTLLERMVTQDIELRIGTLVLDIHGRLVDGILDKIPPLDTDRCFYLDMTDPNWSFGLNLFECDDPSQASIVADQAVTLFRKIWSDSWGQTLQTILFNTAFVFATHGNLTLAEVPRFLRDEAFRERITAVLPAFHPVRDFWEYDYRTTTDRGSTIRRVQEFIASDTLYRVVAQQHSTIPFRQMMDEGMTLLVKLDRQQERASELVGALILSRVFQAALSRLDDMTEAECYAHQFHLYCDEYDRFGSPQFAEMMREVRKCGLGITIAHQDRDKLDSANEAATLQLGSQIVFRVGIDASELSRYFPRPTELGEPVQKRKMQSIYKTWTTVRWAKPEDEQHYNEGAELIKMLDKAIDQQKKQREKTQSAWYRIDSFAKDGVNPTIDRESWKAVVPESLIDFIKTYGKKEEIWDIYPGVSRRHRRKFIGVEYRLYHPSPPFDITVAFSAEQMVQRCEVRNEEMFKLLSSEGRAELRSILQRLFEQYLRPRVFHYTAEFKALEPEAEYLSYAAYNGELQFVEKAPSMKPHSITAFFRTGGYFEPLVFSESMLEPVTRFCDQLKQLYEIDPEYQSMVEQKRQDLIAIRKQLWEARVTETHQEYLGDTPVTGYDPASGRENAPMYELVREPRQLTQAEFAQRLSSLPDRTAWAKLVTGSVHRIQTLPPRPPTDVDRADIMARSQERFCRTRQQIQLEISRRHGDQSGASRTDQDTPAPTKRVRKREPLSDAES